MKQTAPMDATWNSVATIPPLAPDELQVWRIELQDAEDLIDRCATILSYEEQVRAERRIAGRVRNEFVLGRCCLRLLLAANNGDSPEEIGLHQDAFGKPRRDGHLPPEFNVSHSGGTILIALSVMAPVGIDVEQQNPEINVTELAPSVMSGEEQALLMAQIRHSDRLRLFYRVWARKEAVVKADGRGLSIPLTSFSVPAGEAGEAEIEIDGKSYRLSDIPLGQERSAAVAVESHDCRTTLWNFPLSALKALPVKR